MSYKMQCLYKCNYNLEVGMEIYGHYPFNYNYTEAIGQVSLPVLYIYIRAPQQIAQIGNSCNSIRETNWVVRLAQNSHIMRC